MVDETKLEVKFLKWNYGTVLLGTVLLGRCNFLLDQNIVNRVQVLPKNMWRDQDALKNDITLTYDL